MSVFHGDLLLSHQAFFSFACINHSQSVIAIIILGFVIGVHVNSLAEPAFSFAAKGDSWGRMFGYNEWIHKLFPVFSEYDLLRDISMDAYKKVKVIISIIPVQ